MQPIPMPHKLVQQILAYINVGSTSRWTYQETSELIREIVEASRETENPILVQETGELNTNGAATEHRPPE